jgi:hypothetical protein
MIEALHRCGRLHHTHRAHGRHRLFDERDVRDRRRLTAPADSWVDPRAQMVTLGNRSFLNGQRCTAALLAELRELIDALKK